jgi:hypothetical protein
VIFEVGFSEGYQDLLGDMGQWLLKSGGTGCAVQLVVLVTIEEDRTSLTAFKKLGEEAARVEASQNIWKLQGERDPHFRFARQ